MSDTGMQDLMHMYGFMQGLIPRYLDVLYNGHVHVSYKNGYRYPHRIEFVKDGLSIPVATNTMVGILWFRATFFIQWLIRRVESA